MFRLIIFDWDDVITLGATDGYIECYRKAIKGIGITVDPEIERKIILKNWGKTYKEEIAAVIGNNSLIENAVEVFKREFFGNTFIDKLKIVPGVNILLSNLSKSYKLAVATGNHPDLLVKKIMPKFDIPNVFSKIMYSSKLPNPGLAKPNPFMLFEIMKEFGIAPENTLYVGDAKTDVLMANNAGVKIAVVLTGHLTKQDATKMNVWKIIDSAVDLDGLLT